MILMLITDARRACPDARTDRALAVAMRAWVGDAIAAGVDLVQLREPWLSARGLRQVTAELVAAARGSSTRILVNDRLDVARAAGAHGVHLRDDGAAAARVRSWWPAPAVVGQSVHGAGVLSAVDYAVFGAVFGSGPKPPVGLAALTTVARQSMVPVLAVGGVTPASVPACRSAGAAGVAAISIFLPPGAAPGALGPGEAVHALRAADRVTGQCHE